MKARPHHYRFAYQYLPTTFWTQAGRRMLLRALAGEGNALLHSLWGQLGRDLPPEAQLAPEGLSCSLHDAGAGLATLLVMMPAAQIQPEAIALALVVEPRTGELIRYVTLEHTQPGAAPMLGERLRGGRRNYGDGPLDAQGFLSFVRDLVATMCADVARGDAFIRAAHAAWQRGDLRGASAQVLDACAAFDAGFADERLMDALTLLGDPRLGDPAPYRAQAVWLGFARTVSVEHALRATAALREVIGVKGARAATVAAALRFKLQLSAGGDPRAEAWHGEVSRMVVESAPAGTTNDAFNAWIDAHGLGDFARCFTACGDVVEATRQGRPWVFDLTRAGLPDTSAPSGGDGPRSRA